MREKSDAVADVEKTNQRSAAKPPDLVMGRVFDAPRALVFEAWSSREHFVRWFAPKGFTMPSCEADFRAGGVLRFTFRATDGSQHSFDGRYVETTQGERIVFEGRLSDGMQVHTVVTFASVGDERTNITVRQTYSVASPSASGAPHGWTQTLDNLRDHLDAMRASR